METTEAAVSALDTMMESFYTPINLNDAILTVSHHFFSMFAIFFSIFVFMFILHKLLTFCEKAFDSEAIRKMEGGGIWNKLPDGSLYNGLEKIASVRVFDKLTRRK